MIEVSIMLHDSDELAVYHQFLRVIEGRRQAWREKMHQDIRAARQVRGREAFEAAQPAAPPEGAEPETPVQEEKVVATITPEGVAKPAKGPSLKDVTDVLTRLVNATDVPTAREVLLGFGAGSIAKIDQSKWPELVEALEAKIAQAAK